MSRRDYLGKLLLCPSVGCMLWEQPQILDEDMATCGNQPDEKNRVSRTGALWLPD